MEDVLASRTLTFTALAAVVGLAGLAFSGSAYATGSGSGKHILVTCPAGFEPNTDTQHTTNVQIRNVSNFNNAFRVTSVKVYGADGGVLKSMPRPDAFPPSFVPNPPAHGASVLSTGSIFAASAPLLSIVFDVQVNSYSVPFFFLAVHIDRTNEGTVYSRDAEPCVY